MKRMPINIFALCTLLSMPMVENSRFLLVHLNGKELPHTKGIGKYSIIIS